MLHAHSHVSHLSSCPNTPEEDDETMNTEDRAASVVHKPDSTCTTDGHHPPPAQAADSDDHLFCREQEHKHIHTLPHTSPSFCSSQHHRSLTSGYSQPTPFQSQADSYWLHPSFASSWSGYPNSLPSCLSHKEYSSCSGESCFSRYKFDSLPSTYSTSMSSLEHPFSLRSNPPSAELYHHTFSPYSCLPQGAACCAQCPADGFNRGPVHTKYPWPQYHPAHGHYCKSAQVNFYHLQEMATTGNWCYSVIQVFLCIFRSR